MIDFDSRVEIRQGFTGNRVSSRPLSSRPTPADRHRCTTRSTSRSRNFEGQGRQRGRCAAAGADCLLDGEDTSSLVSFEEVLDLAKRSETAIYAIALRGNDVQAKGSARRSSSCGRWPRRPAAEPSSRPHRGSERRLCTDRRRARQPAHPRLLAGNQRRDGAWRRLVVQVARANITPRTKKGYYAPTGR